MESYFLDIPIYRCSEKKYLQELDKLRSNIHTSLEPQRKSVPEYNLDDIENRLFENKSYPYEYNEIIGWIKLYVLGTQLRGEYFFEVSSSKSHSIKTRINKGVRKKRFELFGKAFELSIRKEMNSHEIFTSLCERLVRLNLNERPFINRHLDLANLMAIGPHLNWISLMNNLDPYRQ
ncbi:MAG: hypothetical protein GQ574_07200 [Crocinitomix sp.]|nr:hypothetical protein [Crocinitomix sp.]